MKLADLEYGDSSIGVTLIREEGESKDCERWILTFGEGVRGGGQARAAILGVFPNKSSELDIDIATCGKNG
jgi:hypothetical protein